MPSNDIAANDSPDLPDTPDAHGQAALLLVESLLHGLCENATLTHAQAADIAERALDVQTEHVEAGGGAGKMRRAQALLSNIASSLNIDRDNDPAS